MIAGKVSVFASIPIVKEYFEVIREIGKDRDEHLAERWISLLAQNLKMVAVADTTLRCRDADDDKFIQCAVTVRADYIISGDSDLLVLHEVDGIQIAPPNEMVKLLRG